MPLSTSLLFLYLTKEGLSMATIAFAGLKFEVPDDWHNESTLVFSMPTTEGLSTPMAMNPQYTPPTANITVSWEKANGLSAKEFLDLRLGHIPQIFPGFEKQEAGLTDEGMPYAQYKVPAEPPFIQLVCVKASEDKLVCITGTALESTFSKARSQFFKTAQSLR